MRIMHILVAVLQNFPKILEICTCWCYILKIDITSIPTYRSQYNNIIGKIFCEKNRYPSIFNDQLPETLIIDYMTNNVDDKQVLYQYNGNKL